MVTSTLQTSAKLWVKALPPTRGLAVTLVGDSTSTPPCHTSAGHLLARETGSAAGREALSVCDYRDMASPSVIEGLDFEAFEGAAEVRSVTTGIFANDERCQRRFRQSRASARRLPQMSRRSQPCW